MGACYQYSLSVCSSVSMTLSSCPPLHRRNGPTFSSSSLSPSLSFSPPMSSYRRFSDIWCLEFRQNSALREVLQVREIIHNFIIFLYLILYISVLTMISLCLVTSLGKDLLRSWGLRRQAGSPTSPRSGLNIWVSCLNIIPTQIQKSMLYKF